MEYKIQAIYSAKVLFEFSVAVSGESYLIIYGEHVNGYFCCVPNYEGGCWGCEMAEPSDVQYNCNKLIETCKAPLNVAIAIANAINKMSEKQAEQKNNRVSDH